MKRIGSVPEFKDVWILNVNRGGQAMAVLLENLQSR